MRAPIRVMLRGDVAERPGEKPGAVLGPDDDPDAPGVHHVRLLSAVRSCLTLSPGAFAPMIDKIGAVVNRVRALWRGARRLPVVGPILAAGDRVWWARVIRRAGIVDLGLVAAQGRPLSARRAVRRYVRGGFRSGFSLNPLIMERLVASQLSDVGRVPALYAYLVNDPRRIEANVSWDSRRPGHDLLEDPAGPLGATWRSAMSDGSISLGTTTVAWSKVEGATRLAAAQATGRTTIPPLQPVGGETVLVCRIDELEDASTPLRLVARFGSQGVPIVISLAGSNADQWVSASLLTLWLPNVQITRDDGDPVTAVRAIAPDAVLLVRGPSADVSMDTLRILGETARRTGRVAAPVWLDLSDGTIVSAGVGSRHGRPFDVLAGHPAEDAKPLDSELEVPRARGTTLALPPAARSGALVLTASLVRAPRGVAASSDTVQSPDTDLDGIIARAGFRTDSWKSGSPVLRRLTATATLDDGRVVPRLRWAVKIAAPPGPRGEWWGDTHYARGIADALRRLGQEVVIDAYAARERPSSYLDDVVLALRGPEPLSPQRGARSLLWIISHPDEIQEQDVVGFDAVFAASEPWAAEASARMDLKISPLLQCTDIRRFHPRGLARSSDLVFVGTARGIPRPSIIEPLRAGIPISVFGPDWSGWIPGAAIKGSGVANADLPAVYESAGAILNDHWPAMQSAGFVSNRLFDVVAAGGRAVSDHVVGIPELFGGAVRTYADIPELLELLSGDLDQIFPAQEEVAAISQRVRALHSFDARARTLLHTALSL
ncbi:glycosyltransferase [Microbacterium trichothecenolyticum]|uniref:CgeB family protein n=1 Tax=Microbacterium trichothecenolyticum TaxID=69370 RepID=UPI0035BE38EB